MKFSCSLYVKQNEIFMVPAPPPMGTTPVGYLLTHRKQVTYREGVPLDTLWYTGATEHFVAKRENV